MPQPDPVSPTTVSPSKAPDPAHDAPPPGVAGSKSQDYWANTRPTTLNPAVGTISPGQKPVTDISAVRKPPPGTTQITPPVTNNDQQRAQIKKAVGQNVQPDPTSSSNAGKTRPPGTRGTAPSRGTQLERMPRVRETYVSDREVNRGASYDIRGDQAKYLASKRSGYHVYVYLDQNGEQLYVGKSGGINDPGQNWENRLQNDHINTDWIAGAKYLRVYYDLTESEMWGLEEDRIPASIHKDANRKPGEFSRLHPHEDLSEVVRAAEKKPSAMLSIDVVPTRYR